MDVHVRRSITLGLRRRGVDVLTAQEDGHERATDPELLDRSGALNRIIFTQDDDFLVEAHRRQLAGEPFAGVIYSHQTCSIGRCIADLEVVAKVGEADDFRDRVEYLPL